MRGNVKGLVSNLIQSDLLTGEEYREFEKAVRWRGDENE